MHFEITASQQAVRKPLTTAQRNSSLFSEAPRIGATTLRRGQVLKFDESQMKHHEVILKRLFDAGAIEISEVEGAERHDLRTEKSKMQSERRPEPKEKKVAPPPSAPKPPPVTERAPVPETAVQKEYAAIEDKKFVDAIDAAAAQAPASEEIPASPPSSPAPVSTESKGKKGRK